MVYHMACFHQKLPRCHSLIFLLLSPHPHVLNTPFQRFHFNPRKAHHARCSTTQFVRRRSLCPPWSGLCNWKFDIRKLLYFVWSPPWHDRTYIWTYLETILTFYLTCILTFYLAFFPAFYLALYLTFYLAFYLVFFLHSIWHCIWHFYLAFYLAFYLTYIQTFYLTFYLAFYLAFYLTYILPFYLAFYLTYILTFYQFYLTFYLAFYLMSGEEEDVMTSKNLTTLTWQMGNYKSYLCEP